MILTRNYITYRIRKEGNVFIATVKWKGRAEGNLHIRNEINKVTAIDNKGRNLFVPDLNIFKGEDIGKQIRKLIGNEGLKPIMSVEVIRNRCRIKERETLIELAVDDSHQGSDNFSGRSGIMWSSSIFGKQNLFTIFFYHQARFTG